MSLFITDRRTTVDDAEAVTNWTNVGFGTTSSDVAEETNAVAASINIGNQSMYYTQPAGSVNLGTSPGTLVYVYSFNNALQNAWDNTIPPQALLLGDGTNRIGFHMAGANRRVFNHLDGPTSWQCLVLDTSQASAQNTAGLTYADAGSFASLNLGAVTQWGCYFETLSKALGGGYNVATDIIRYGNDGIRVTSGTTGDPGTCQQLASGDRSTADGAAHGIFRELNPVAFGCQGPLTFGDSGNATNSVFIDSNIVISYEDRNISDDKYYLNVEGNASATNIFELRNSTITTAGPYVSMDMSSSSIESLIFDAVSFTALGNDITFPTDYLVNTRDHEVTNCTFNGCGVISAGTSIFQDNNIADAVLTSTEGSLLIDSNSDPDNWSNLAFTRGASGHAVKITATGTFDFNSFTYAGYSGSGTEAAVYNDSGGSVTINIVGGDTPTVRNGTSATTTVNNAVTVKVENVAEGSSIVIDAAETVGTITAGDRILEALADSNGEASTSFSYESAFEPSGLDVVCRVRNQGFPNAAISASIASGFVDETTAANSSTTNDMTLLPDVLAQNDAYYFGDNEQFLQMRIDISQAAVTGGGGGGGADIVWEYWNGSLWASLPGLSDGTDGLTVAGENVISWTTPSGWATTTVDSKGPYYYVRLRENDPSPNYSTLPRGRWCKLDTTRYLPFTQNRIITSAGLTVNVNQIEDTISTF